MKKVIALALAAVMVCTMAFALNIGTGTSGSGDVPEDVAQVIPGQDIIITLPEGTNVYEENGKFVPSKNVVTVTFSKGSDLIASQKWVENTDGKWVYVLTTKESLNDVFTDNVDEIVVTKVTFKATGETLQTYKPEEGKTAMATFNLGYNDGGSVALEIKTVDDNTVYRVVKNEDNKLEDTVTLETINNMTIKVPLKAGMVYTNKLATLSSAAEDALNKNIDKNMATVVARYDGHKINLAGSAVVTKANDKYRAYAINDDGTVTALNYTLDDGVMTVTLNSITPFVVVEGTLTASAGTGNGTTGNGNGNGTTNPETGANDIVGVAAALAVVAVASAAAISLKKA